MIVIKAKRFIQSCKFAYLLKNACYELRDSKTITYSVMLNGQCFVGTSFA